MIESKSKVIIYEEPWKDAVNIVIMQIGENGDRYVAQPVESIFKKIDEATRERKPTITISGMFAHDILKAFSEALDEKDIKTDNDFKIKGLLDATKYHLEDLRKLLKLKE